jgi:hypothetical protein
MEALALEQAGKLALQGSGWALAVIFGILLILRDRQYGECLKAQIGLATQMATALERSSVTNAAVAASLDSRTGVFERLTNSVGDLSHEVEANARSVTDRVVANGAILDRLQGGLGEIQKDLIRIGGRA